VRAIHNCPFGKFRCSVAMWFNGLILLPVLLTAYINLCHMSFTSINVLQTVQTVGQVEDFR